MIILHFNHWNFRKLRKRKNLILQITRIRMDEVYIKCVCRVSGKAKIPARDRNTVIYIYLLGDSE